jgi:aminoglycoside N3'-acetyltransferase
MTSIGIVTRQLSVLGLPPGAVVVVHSAFSKVGPIENGPVGLIDALQAAVGSEGTVMMPSMTDEDESPFDRRTTSCRSLGIVSETFWRRPGVLRSDNPHAFAAAGPAAGYLTAAHPIDFPHGPDSPIGRLHELDGWVLLLGVGHDANTTIHLAEATASVRYRRDKVVTVLEDGLPKMVEYREIDHCCQRFALVDRWLDLGGSQRHGRVGRAEARLVRARAVVEVVVAELRRDENIFLHPRGVDAECDDAWRSLAPSP